VNGPTFLTTGAAPVSSPLARVLAGAHGIRDLSLLVKHEVRGAEPGAGAIQIRPGRFLVIGEPAESTGLVVDVTSALAGIEVDGEPLLRRLTALELDALPATGKVAGVTALLTRDGDSFRIFFAQEYGESVVEAVRDVQEGLA